MRSLLSSATCALLAALTLSIAPTSTAQPASATAGKAAVRASAYQVLLTFDHHQSLRPGSGVRDASGHRHRGKVLVEAGGTLHSDSGMVRRSADFPGTCHTCGRAIVEIADGRGLDPGARDFTFGAAVRVTGAQSANGQNLLQKGYFNQDGGQWKLQLSKGGFPSCVVFGSQGRVKVDTEVSVANRRWHRVSCTRTGDRVRIRVDGRIRGSAHGATGRIASTAPVRVGGKKIAAGNKQFHGDIDTVGMRILR